MAKQGMRRNPASPEHDEPVGEPTAAPPAGALGRSSMRGAGRATARAAPGPGRGAPRDPLVEAIDEAAVPGLALAPRAPVVALRWWGRGDPPAPLAPGDRRWSVGAGACDVVVPRALAAAVSARHAVLTRVDSGLRIEDCGSKNGTYRSLGSARLASFQLEAGERFWLADVPVLAVDAPLEALRPRLAACVGLDRHDAVDRALEPVAAGRPLALVGPAGTGAASLARAIHDAGPQRGNPFVIVDGAPPAPDAIRGGTVVVDLDRVRRLPARHLRSWLDAAGAVRLVVLATDERRVRACLDTYRDELHAIALVPLDRRPEDVVRLIGHCWRDELASTRGVAELGPAVDGLAAYRWPRNLDELREHAPRLLAYLEHGGLRAAAVALGVTHQTLGDHFRRIGFAPAPRWSPGLPSRAREPGLLALLADWARYLSHSDENRCGGDGSVANTAVTSPVAQ